MFNTTANKCLESTLQELLDTSEKLFALSNIHMSYNYPISSTLEDAAYKIKRMAKDIRDEIGFSGGL